MNGAGTPRRRPTPPAIHAQGAACWPLALARELDDAILHLRINELEIGTWVLKTEGDADRASRPTTRLLAQHADHWLVRETIGSAARARLQRLDVSSRTLFALVEPGSCFAGTLLELALAADRSYMLDGCRDDADAARRRCGSTELNFGRYPMVNGLTRLQRRFYGEPSRVDELHGRDRPGRSTPTPR